MVTHKINKTNTVRVLTQTERIDDNIKEELYALNISRDPQAHKIDQDNKNKLVLSSFH